MRYIRTYIIIIIIIKTGSWILLKFLKDELINVTWAWDKEKFESPTRVERTPHTSHFINELKIAIFIHISLLTVTLTVLILAECRTPVTYELSQITLLSMSSRSSVDRASAMCSIPVWDSDSLSHTLVHVDQFTFHVSLPSLKFTIFIHLSLSRVVFNIFDGHPRPFLYRGVPAKL